MRRFAKWLFRLTPYRIAVWFGVVVTAVHVASAGTTGRVDKLPVVGRIESIMYDLAFRERGVRKPPDDVVVAAVDEKAEATLGLFPWSRDEEAKLVDNLTALGAKAIAFDVSFTDDSFRGKDAEARKLAARLGQVSLAAPVAQPVFDELSDARKLALEAHLAPLGEKLGSIDDALRGLQKQQSELSASLASYDLARSPDEVFGDSVRRSGRVVLGSFLMTARDLVSVSAGERSAALKAVSHMALPTPTVEPTGLKPDSLVDALTTHSTTPPRFMPDYPGVKAPIAALLGSPQARTRVAFFNVEPDSDGTVRRVPLVFQVGAAPDIDDRTFLPSLDLGALLAYSDASPATTHVWSASADDAQIEEVALEPRTAVDDQLQVRAKDLVRIPVDPGGQLLVNYYGPNGTMPHVSLADVWTGDVPRDRIAGKIVLFGVTAIGTHDQRVTPFEKFSPGVDVHAAALDNVLAGDFLMRPWWALFAEVLVLMLIAFVGGRVLSRVSVVGGIPVVLAIVVAWHLAGLELFSHGLALFSFMPLGEVSGIYVLQTIYRYLTEEKKARDTRRAFQHYLSQSVMEEVLKDPTKLKLGGEKKELTVLFSDIRGFTSISEKLEPEQLAHMINDYLTPMTNLVFDHGGTLDKYIGDALMAIWGAPHEQPDHALRCCRTAVAMMRELDYLQSKWKAEGRAYPPIDIGIGINSGPMVVGNMGADQRFDYTVLGDNVNLASRLEGTNKEYRSHIIISESTCRACEGKVAARELGAVRVKGKREPVRIYELLDDKPAEGERAELIALFDAGVAAFRERRWKDSRAKFREVLEKWPDDGPAQAYLEFCDASEANPPGEDWDGVYTMTHK